MPNASTDPLPVAIHERSETSTTSSTPTQLTIAVDIDSTISADAWRLTAVIADDPALQRDLTFTGHQAELLLEAPRFDDAAAISIELTGTTKLSDGTEYTLGHRVVKTQFRPYAHTMAYLFVDQQCAYSAVGLTDGGSGCANPADWCYEGSCRTENLAAKDLATYRSDWKNHPPSPCEAATPEVKLGEGFATIVEKQDGDTVTIECGPQGGHHIWVAALTKGLDQRNPVITVTSPPTDAGAGLVTSYPLLRLYAPEPPPGDAGVDAAGSGSCEAKGVQLQLDPDGRPVQPYLGKPIDITLAMQDKNGQKAQVTRHLNVAPKLSTTSCFGP